MNIQMRLSFVK